LARGLILNTLSQMLFALSAMAIHFWLGRKLGQAAYGDVVVILSTATVTCIVLKNGLREATSRFAATNPGRELGAYLAAMKIQMPLSLGIAAIVFFGSDLIASELNDMSLSVYLKIIALQAPGIALYYLSYGFLNGRKRFGRHALLTAAHSIFRAAFILGLVLMGIGIAGVAAGTVAAASCTGLLGLLLSLDAGRAKALSVAPLLGLAVPIAIFFTSVALLMHLDILMLKRLCPVPTAVGDYGAAGTFARAPFFLLTAFYGVLLPLVASAHAAKNKELVREYISMAVRYLLLILLPALALLSSLAKEIVVFFYGDRFAAAGAPLSILCVGTGFLLVTVQLLTVLQASGKPVSGTVLMIVLLPVDVALCALLIPRYGGVGAALATTITAGLGFVAAAGLVFAAFRAVPPLRSVANALVSSALVYGLGRMFSAQGHLLVMLMFVLGAAYLVCLLSMREFTLKDWRMLRQMFALPEREASETVSNEESL